MNTTVTGNVVSLDAWRAARAAGQRAVDQEQALFDKKEMDMVRRAHRATDTLVMLLGLDEAQAARVFRLLVND